MKAAAEDDWATEYLDKILSVKVVASLDEALAFIERYGSALADAIVTEDYTAAWRFLAAVDSAVANHLMQTVQATRLMGAHTLISGLSAENAQTLVRLGLDLTPLNTVGTLADGVLAAGAILAEAEERSRRYLSDRR